MQVKIIPIVENTTINKKYKAKHGISFYIETNKYKILFDTGPNKVLIKNAEKLGIDLSLVDIVIISHGHTDHGGGLKYFLEINKTAKIYIQKNAFEKYYTKIINIPIYIGLDNDLINNEQIILVDGNYKINEQLSLISNIIKKTFHMKSNDALLTKVNNKFQKDPFIHEQSLIIENNDKSVLITGCSHQGVIDIQEESERIIKRNIDNVIGGFHIFNPINRRYENPDIIKNMGLMMKAKNTRYYTCHCTGKKGYEKMKEILLEDINYLSVGSEVEL